MMVNILASGKRSRSRFIEDSNVILQYCSSIKKNYSLFASLPGAIPTRTYATGNRSLAEELQLWAVDTLAALSRFRHRPPAPAPVPPPPPYAANINPNSFLHLRLSSTTCPTSSDSGASPTSLLPPSTTAVEAPPPPAMPGRHLPPHLRVAPPPPRLAAISTNPTASPATVRRSSIDPAALDPGKPPSLTSNLAARRTAVAAEAHPNRRWAVGRHATRLLVVARVTPNICGAASSYTAYSQPAQSQIADGIIVLFIDRTYRRSV
jgi:hypothetical protein